MQEYNDTKKNSGQLSWSPTLIFCQLLIYIIKKKKKYKNWEDIKPDSVNPYESTLTDNTLRTTHNGSNLNQF